MLTILPSDGSDSKQLTEQVLAIYPILAGQKQDSSNQIPPRPAESKSAPAPDAAKSTHDDLIDFGQDDAPVQPPQPQRPTASLQSNVESTGEISGLLKSTGKPAADGPLLDFHHDLQKTIPEIRRSDTTGSTDAFVDAKD